VAKNMEANPKQAGVNEIFVEFILLKCGPVEALNSPDFNCSP